MEDHRDEPDDTFVVILTGHPVQVESGPGQYILVGNRSTSLRPVAVKS
ncbi:MAG: hypothetical protein Q8P50_06450 [Bacillota bacterium]|nr:hypothetical protein [Bacillota bacterium]